MPEVQPFRGIRYNPEKVDLNKVIAPPYDIITPELQEELYKRDPHNIVRLDLPREVDVIAKVAQLFMGDEGNAPAAGGGDRYSTAASLFNQWKNDGTLIQDEEPSVYFCLHSFTTPDGKSMERRGFIARCRVEEYEKKIILPHEKTLSAPKEDRLKLVEATKAQFSSVFGFYSDANKVTASTVENLLQYPPEIEVTYDGVICKIWKVTNAELIKPIADMMKIKPIFIADGHHRYETAIAYRDNMKSQNAAHMGKEPYNYTMIYLANRDEGGLVILPTHRLVANLQNFDKEKFFHSLQEYFQIQFLEDMEQMTDALAQRKTHSFGLIFDEPKQFIIIYLTKEESLDSVFDNKVPAELKTLDATLLHDCIFLKLLGMSKQDQEDQKNLMYSNSTQEAAEAVFTKKAQFAVIMNPTQPDQVRSVVKANASMPPKSTYFYPKLFSGLVINPVAE